jgi:hypothetical protein
VSGYAEWQAYEDQFYIAAYAARNMVGAYDDINAEMKKIMHDDATYQVWRQ